MRQTIICLLVKADKILLAMKKRGHGAGKWNGVGGKAQTGETIEQAAIREAREEIGVTLRHFVPVARLTFHFSPDRAVDNESTVFLCDIWDGEPIETEEMRPQWFTQNNIPYADMWACDARWLPKVLAGKLLVADVVSTDTDELASYQEREVEQLP